MKKLMTTMAIALLAAACGPAGDAPGADTAAGDAKVFDMPYLMRDLENGLRVIVVPTDFPDIVTIQIPVKTGSRNEVEPGKTGFAHFFEHMMFRGTEKYPARQVSRNPEERRRRSERVHDRRLHELPHNVYERGSRENHRD